MSLCAKFFPPYYKYPVFLFVGFTFTFSAVVLAISEAYYKAAELILPIAYKIFNDTVEKGREDFEWTKAEHALLEQYKTIMLTLWALSAIGILICMVVIIPQFFDFNDIRGNPKHMCFILKRLAWIKFFLVAIYIVILGGVLIWAWLVCPRATHLFHEHFNTAEMEEVYLTEMEEKLDCTTDDDKEVEAHANCWQNVQMSFIKDWWLQAGVIVFFVGHSIAFLLIPLVNRNLFPYEEDEIEAAENRKFIEA